MKPLIIGIGILAALLVTADRPAAADADRDKTLSPYFFIPDGDPESDRLPLKETTADVSITGVIADVLVTQEYRNEGTRPIHARYVFPASTRAAVHGMTLQVGAHRIRAQIREKEEARQEFESASAEGKSAALLEQQRANVFSMNVANIMPGDEIRVELHYSEILIPTDGIYEFVYPAVVGPRYANQPESSAPASDRWVKSAYLREGQAPTYAFHIETHIAAGMPLEELWCASHLTAIEWDDPSTARVLLEPEEIQGGNRDYILRYRLQGSEVETGLLLYEGAEENFFLLLVQPPRRVVPEQVPPREYIFVIDVSGSMYGFPLDTAKALIRELVRGLRPIDRFNVLLFCDGSSVLAPESLPATPENLQRALETIDRQRGGGGTELASALQHALDLPGAERVARSTIVITDGYVAAERDTFDIIRNNLHRSNVFAFGIGGSVNRYLIEGMAAAGQGEPFVVTDASDAIEAAERFEKYVQAPLLTDIAIAFDGFEAYDIEPPSMPDLFASRPLVIFGKWRGEAAGVARVSGMSGTGPYQEDIDVAESQSADEHSALRYLWARSRVARLSDYGPGVNDDTRPEVTSLGLTYDLLTAYTSFIAVHEVVRNFDGAQTVDQPLPLPAGVSTFAVGQSVPEPELPVLLLILLGGVVLLRRGQRAC